MTVSARAVHVYVVSLDSSHRAGTRIHNRHDILAGNVLCGDRELGVGCCDLVESQTRGLMIYNP